MKHLRNIARGPRSTPRGSPKQVCARFEKSVHELIPFRTQRNLLINNIFC